MGVANGVWGVARGDFAVFRRVCKYQLISLNIIE